MSKKKELTLEQQEQVKNALTDAMNLAVRIEDDTSNVPDGIYFAALAILVTAAKEHPGYELAVKLVDELQDFSKKLSTN